MRAPLEGSTSILIRNGKIDMQEMRRNRLGFGQLRMLLRQKDVFSMGEVAYAIFENNGSLSVMKNPEYEEGDILKDNLKKIGEDKGFFVMEG
ncbi:DUF421 domain-containing protein [Paenibacillus durus]|uniref:DUF421 domain-containing protein n=1 Tax=Paenibacillus durus TaxID=44251 RepID=UPI00046F2AD3|nr:DUF421 domain-containing protein [Paenibacillus durus]